MPPATAPRARRRSPVRRRLGPVRRTAGDDRCSPRSWARCRVRRSVRTRPAEALVEAAVRAQEAAGIEPLTDGAAARRDGPRRGLGDDREPDRAGRQAGPPRAVQPGLVRRRRRGPAHGGDARPRRRGQRHPPGAGRRRLPADRGPRALGDRDRGGCRGARAVPRGAPATPRRRRRDTPLARHHRRQRRRRRDRDDPGRSLREPRRGPHRGSRQLASRRERTGRDRDRVRRAVPGGRRRRRARGAAVGGGLRGLDRGSRPGPGGPRDRVVAGRAVVARGDPASSSVSARPPAWPKPPPARPSRRSTRVP